jgi:hypothetical protein
MKRANGKKPPILAGYRRGRHVFVPPVGELSHVRGPQVARCCNAMARQFCCNATKLGVERYAVAFFDRIACAHLRHRPRHNMDRLVHGRDLALPPRATRKGVSAPNVSFRPKADIRNRDLVSGGRAGVRGQNARALCIGVPCILARATCVILRSKPARNFTLVKVFLTPSGARLWSGRSIGGGRLIGPLSGNKRGHGNE